MLFLAKLLYFQEMTNISSRKSECWIPFVERWSLYRFHNWNIPCHFSCRKVMQYAWWCIDKFPSSYLHTGERTKVAFLLYVLPSWYNKTTVEWIQQIEQKKEGLLIIEFLIQREKVIAVLYDYFSNSILAKVTPMLQWWQTTRKQKRKWESGSPFPQHKQSPR